MTQPQDELASGLKEAALQALLMRPRRIDLKQELEHEREFIYGVDANVIRFWANPRGADSERGYSLGQIFQTDTPNLSTAIARGLLGFIFDRLSPNRPVLLVPPIEREVATIIDALHDTDPRQPSKALQTQTASLFEQLASYLSAEDLAQVNLEIQDILFHLIGEHQELNRILSLFAARRVAKLDEVEQALPTELARVLLPQGNALSQWGAYGEARAGLGDNIGWTRRLSRAGVWRTEALRDHDADVLARIEVWNRLLDAARLKYRVLYITADHRLFAAAATYRSPELAPDSNFAEAYLRHPRAYLSESGVLGETTPTFSDDRTQRPESVGDWLTLLTQPAEATFADLIDTTRDHSQPPQAIREFAQELTAKGSLTAKDLSDKWASFAKGALVANPPTAHEFIGLAKLGIRSARALNAAVARARKAVDEQHRQTLGQYIAVATRLGGEIENLQEGKIQVRTVAPVHFEAWTKANASIAMISRWPEGEMDQDAYDEAMALIDGDDNTSYAFFIANAVFFAGRGRWAAAALVARRAREHVLSLDSADQHGANGREAAYFEGFCRRHTARNAHDLEQARNCLEAARDIFTREKLENAQDHADWDYVEERFDVEEAATDLSAYLFETLTGSAPAPQPIAFRKIANRHWALLGDISRVAPGGTILDAPIPPPPIAGTAEDARLRTEMSLLLTVISLACLPEAEREDGRRARSALEVMERHLDSEYYDENMLSLFGKTIVSAARLRNLQIKPDREARRRFEDLFNRAMEKRNLILAYDGPRFEELRRAAGRPWP